jgi:hypothetical protein
VDLAQFLLARIAEDEAANDELVRAEVARCRADGMPSLTEDEVRAYWAGQPWWERRVAECDAKRRIVDAWVAADHAAGSYPGTMAGIEQGLDAALQFLALPYADHPDYDEKWRP